MAEVATPEAPVEAPQEPVADPAPAPSPAPEPVEPPAEGEAAEPTAGIDLKDALKGATVAELRQVLDSVPAEVRTELEAEIERRGEQRAVTREREVDSATRERHAAYKQYAEQGQRAARFLTEKVSKAKGGDFDAFTDVDTITAAINDYRNGAIAEAALENETALKPIRDKYLPEPTDEEKAALEKLVYEDGKKGTMKQLPALMDLVIERARADAFAEGVKKGEGNLKAKESLIEKLAKAQEIRKQAPGLAPGGSAAPAESTDAIQRDIAQLKQDINTGKITYAEYTERDNKIRARIAALPRKE